MAPKLSLLGVTKSFGERRVLDELFLEIEPEEALVVMGPSGEGKTVLLRHLVGLLQPDSGTVRVDGTDLWALSERERNRVRRRFGVAFQEGALFDSMTVFDNVAFPLRRHTSMTPREVEARVRACLELVRLGAAWKRWPAELSTGMRRRAGFARAIVLEPEILLFDEPTAGLDPVMVTVVGQVISELHRRLKATTVVVTHDLQSARDMAQRIALLFRGKILASDRTERFFESTNPAVRQFVEGRAEGPLLSSRELGAT